MFIYGPRQWANAGYKSVIVKNFERMLSGKCPVVCGDGRQTLDYLYVSDAATATIRAVSKAKSGEIYNVGSGVERDVLSLTKTMAGIANWTGDIMYESPDWTAGSYRVADISKARGDLDWTPRISLDEGLLRTFEWMKEG
jgi:UDP-glucose 4-epimerase